MQVQEKVRERETEGEKKDFLAREKKEGRMDGKNIKQKEEP